MVTCPFDNCCFANVHILPANVLSGFAYDMKWAPHIWLPDSFSHDTKKSHTHVYTTLFKLQIRLMKLGNCPNTLAKWLKMLVKKRLTKRLLIEKHVKYSEFVWLPFLFFFQFLFLPYL